MLDKEGVPKTLVLKKNLPCLNTLAEVGAKENEKE